MEEVQSMLASVLRRCRTDRPNILQTLLAVQDTVGYVPPTAIAEIARSLEVTEAEVAGVLSYYPDLRTTPSGRHLVRVCLGESCVASHCGRVLDAICSYLKTDIGETTRDGRFTVERVYCVGNCAVSPSVIIDDDLHGRVVPSQAAALLEKYT